MVARVLGFLMEVLAVLIDCSNRWVVDGMNGQGRNQEVSIFVVQVAGDADPLN